MTTTDQTAAPAVTRSPHRESEPRPDNGYKSFAIGAFEFERDEYFVRISCPAGAHIMDVEDFLRSMMRDVAWGFFYGWVNFDEVFGTVNHLRLGGCVHGGLQPGLQEFRLRFHRTV